MVTTESEKYMRTGELPLSQYLKHLPFRNPHKQRIVLETEDKVIIAFFEIKNSDILDVEDCRIFHQHTLMELLYPETLSTIEYKSKMYGGVALPKAYPVYSFDRFFRNVFKCSS